MFQPPLSPKQEQLVRDCVNEDWKDVMVCLENKSLGWPVFSLGPWDVEFNLWLSSELGHFFAYLTPNHALAFLPESAIHEIEQLNEFLTMERCRLRVIRFSGQYAAANAKPLLHLYSTEKSKVQMRRKFTEHRLSTLRLIDELRKVR